MRTATGRTMTTSHEAYWHGPVWHGTAKMDGRSGYELGVGSSHGAYAKFFKVITYRDGRLTMLKEPSSAHRWGIDSSHSFNVGWTRTMTKGGTVTMTSRLALRSTDYRHTLTTNRYIWRYGTWARASTQKSTVTNGTAYSVGVGRYRTSIGTEVVALHG